MNQHNVCSLSLLREKYRMDCVSVIFTYVYFASPNWNNERKHFCVCVRRTMLQSQWIVHILVVLGERSNQGCLGVFTDFLIGR